MKSFQKPLSTKEEQQYLYAWKQGDVKARDILIEHNLRLVAHIVKKYSNSDKDIEDMISIGTIGLIKAIDTFQVEKGIRLATYASCCIENELLMLFRSEKKMARDVSLLEPIGADKEGNEICLLDIIECEPVNVAEQMDMRNNIQKLGIFMKRVLSKREQDILILRYGLFAAKMGIYRSYVSRIEKKALKKLRDCYELEGEEIK